MNAKSKYCVSMLMPFDFVPIVFFFASKCFNIVFSTALFAAPIIILPSKKKIYKQNKKMPSKYSLNAALSPGPAITNRCLDEVSAQLLKHLRKILAVYTHVTDKGSLLVQYDALKKSEDYTELVKNSAALKLVDVTDPLLSKNERVAFFINIYNLGVLHGFIEHGPPKWMISKYFFFNRVGYQIGPDHFSLNDIENGILRGNRRGMTDICGSPFSTSDRRLNATVEGPVDFRIHFALNCGAISCPPISAYESKKLDKQLDLAAKSYMQHNMNFDAKNKVVTLPELVSWYKNDFGENDQHRIPACLPHAPAEIQEEIRGPGGSGVCTLRYSKFSWTLNESKK